MLARMHHETLAEQFMGKNNPNGDVCQAICFFRFGICVAFGVSPGICLDYGQWLNPLFYELVGMIVLKVVEQCLFKHENVPRKAILQRQPMLVNKEKSSGKDIDAIRFYIKNKTAGQVKTEICKV